MLLTFFTLVSNAAAAAGGPGGGPKPGRGRSLSYAQIAGYEPGSDVQQHNQLDLDQQEL